MGVHRLEIRGIEVLFPFRPYPSQINYMDKVIQCLNESLEDRQTNGRDHCRRNALLESPTGTGKTMCLLCASYAWLLHFQKKYAGVCSCPKIIFASRTHSQLAQAIREVKASPYSPEICILGSREQMCIHPHVSKMYGTMQNRECITRVSSHACEHYENYQLMKREGTAWNVFDSHNKEQGGFVPDIEDLVLEGTKQNFCPFFYSREVMQSKAEIVFMPYNYLIDARVRKQVGIDVSDAILIFDEAHNLEKWCSDAASFDFQTICIAQSVAELERILRDMRSRALTSITPQSKKEQDAEICLQSDLEKLKENLLDLDIFIDDLKDVNITKEGDYLLEILAEANIKQSTYDEFQSRMKSAIYYLEANEFGKKLQCRPTGLRNLNEIMAKVFDIGVTEEEFKNYFRIQIHVENNSWGRKMAHDSLSVLNEEYQSRERPEKNLNQAKTLSLWCFNPGLSMQSLSTHKPQCFILTSGTLSPMDSFAYELGLNFPIRLENPHVIKPDQMCIMTASIGPSNVKLNSSHINRDNAAYYIEIGNFLCNMARIVPDGLLVFFPSYYVLNTCTNLWQQPRAQGGSIFDSIGRFKKIFAEPSDGSQLQTVMSSYEEAIKNAESTQGAIFFAVCRGRVSEGLDFSNRNGRCVIIVGMPFPPVKDPKVVLKRQYLDAAADKHKKEMAEKGTKETIYTGNMWYGQESSRAVNQAIGRVIRNKFDYGAVILCDERYALRQNREQLSRWLQKHVIVSKNFAEIVSTLTKFFKRSLSEFGVNGEILKEKFMKQMELLKDEEEDVELLPPQPKVSRPLVNLHATINNPNFKSVDEEPARQVQQVAEPVKISSNVPVEKYRYGSPAAKKPSITRTLQTTNLSHQVGSDQSEEATPVVLNRTIPNLLVQDTTPANQQPITPPKAIPKQSAPPITGVTPSPNGTEKKQVQKRSNAGDYIKSVKQLLTELEYKEFKEILQNFQKLFSKDKSNSQVHFGGVISRILQIFTGPKAKLLDGLREFIPNNMRSKYDSMIQEAQTPPPTTSSPPSTSSSQQPSSNKRKREDHYDLLTGTRTNKKAHLMESVEPSNEPITIDDDEDDDIPLTLDLTSTVPNIPQRPMSTVSTPSVVPPPTQPPASSSTPMTIDDQGGIKCKVCFEFKNEVANSRCGHVLCQDCWDQCLKVKLECPICRERVRPKTLTKIFL